MTTWTKRKISDIAIEQRIPYTPNPTENLSYIGLEHMEESSLKLNSIGNSREVNSQKKKFYKGDILYGSLRPYFRKVIKAKFDGVSSTDITILKPKENVDRDFLFYLVASEEFINKASMASNGTKMPRAGWKIVKDFSFNIPEPKIQSEIGLMLSVYDDLIENNEKRIKILEEMAQRLYTEWFVKFKFPGHEKVQMVDSGTEFGMIPEGWEIKKLKEIALLTMGQSPESKYYNLDGKGLAFHQGVTGFGNLYPEDRVYSTSGDRYAEKGDLLFSVRAPVGKMNIANKKIILGRGLSAIRSKQNLQTLLIIMFLNKFTSGDMIGNGAVYKSVNRMEIENLTFMYPDIEIARIFEQLVELYFSEIENLSKTNTNLSKIRDLLIPQLVTGKRVFQ